MIVIENHGPLILSSNYWQSDLARAGKLYVSCNAGAVRLLLPTALRGYLNEMRTARHVVLSRGPWPAAGKADAVELLFDDGTESLFALHLSAESFDLLPGEPEAGREWTLTAWVEDRGKPHLALQRVCHWRRVPKIPWLKPWTPP